MKLPIKKKIFFKNSFKIYPPTLFDIVPMGMCRAISAPPSMPQNHCRCPFSEGSSILYEILLKFRLVSKGQPSGSNFSLGNAAKSQRDNSLPIHTHTNKLSSILLMTGCSECLSHWTKTQLVWKCTWHSKTSAWLEKKKKS